MVFKKMMSTFVGFNFFAAFLFYNVKVAANYYQTLK